MGSNSDEVEEITRNFLQQHHEVRNIRVTGFDNGIWSVEAAVHSSSGYSVKKLSVDDKTSKIISVE